MAYGSLLPLIALTLAGMIAGVLVMLLARQARRLDDHPTCRRCRFDLVGLPPGAAACPECGRSLSQSRAVRKGNRRLHKPLLALGALILLGALGAGGIVIAGRVAGAEVDRYKPAWLLTREARAGSPPTADRALKELERRLRASELPDPRARDVVALARARQADPSAAWSTAWGDYLDAAWQVGVMTPDDRAASLLDGLTHSLMCRKRMAVDRPIPLRLITSMSRLGSATGADITFTLTHFEVGGVTTALKLEGGFTQHPGGGGQSQRWNQWPGPLQAPLGEQEMTTTWTITLKPDDPAIPALQRTVTIKQPLTIVSRDESLIELLRDPEMAAQIRSRISVSMEIHTGGAMTDFNLMYSGLPCRLVGVALARERNAPSGARPREWTLAHYSLEAGGMQSNSSWTDAPLEGPIPPGCTSVDVVLRPSEENAASEPGVESMWGEEIVIEAVEARWKKE